MNRLDKIEARANAATEGPWEAGERCVFTLEGAPVISDDVVHYGHGMAGEGVCREEDTEFIAHARADVPALVAALRAVLEMHKREESPSGDYCDECFPKEWDWPCRTVETIRQHLGDNQ